MTCPHNVYRTEVYNLGFGDVRQKLCTACNEVLSSEYLGPITLASQMEELEARIRRLEEAVYGPK